MGSLLALLTTIATGNTSGLSGWEEFGIVLSASALALLLGEGTRRLWLWLHRPRIDVECGNGPSFRREMSGEPWHVAPGIGGTPKRVYVTRLLVRETRNQKAPKVCIQVIESDPVPAPDDPGTLPATLRWTSNEMSHDLTPGDRGHVRLCELVTYPTPEMNWVYGYVPGVDVGKKVRLDIQVFVDGKQNEMHSFLVDWPDDALYPNVSKV